jgi:hypothetical protein
VVLGGVIFVLRIIGVVFRFFLPFAHMLSEVDEGPQLARAAFLLGERESLHFVSLKQVTSRTVH